MFNVEILGAQELTDEEKEDFCLEDWNEVIKVTHNDKVILMKSDQMEPEDCTFSRDLSWICSIINRAYRLGVEDGYKIQG